MEPESEVAAAPNVVRLVNSPNCEDYLEDKELQEWNQLKSLKKGQGVEDERVDQKKVGLSQKDWLKRGIEREITLDCGEQVIPFHEQGVEVEGFHEERREGDDVARERSASPSDERDITCSIFKLKKMKKKNKEMRVKSEDDKRVLLV
ncbi:hypothetical protein TSUD_42450 [Trifolium subterraneum]|uniref:Uncharacterized protein n=1 Tax=Trifolium subterraneum TaxID=3900 RepID=A0A2Z6MEG5_TRISU|nr:hypothetical protein TSUD_42450 [Trifolium subterraneum]